MNFLTTARTAVKVDRCIHVSANRVKKKVSFSASVFANQPSIETYRIGKKDVPIEMVFPVGIIHRGDLPACETAQ